MLTEQTRRQTEAEPMDAYLDLLELASGNTVVDYNSEQDAMKDVMRVIEEHGSSAIATFALSRVQGDQPRLVAMQDDLVVRVVREIGQLVLQDRAS